MDVSEYKFTSQSLKSNSALSCEYHDDATSVKHACYSLSFANLTLKIQLDDVKNLSNNFGPRCMSGYFYCLFESTPL